MLYTMLIIKKKEIFIYSSFGWLLLIHLHSLIFFFLFCSVGYQLIHLFVLLVCVLICLFGPLVRMSVRSVWSVRPFRLFVYSSVRLFVCWSICLCRSHFIYLLMGAFYLLSLCVCFQIGRASCRERV